MWILFIAIVIGYLVFSSIHDHNKDVKTNVTDHGGMLVKYKVLIDYFTFYIYNLLYINAFVVKR